MSNTSKDPVKKIFGKTAEEVLSEPPEPHVKYHSPDAFCGSAGPEEMKHLEILVEQLNDDELRQLVDKSGITFIGPLSEVDRDVLEGVVDEVAREIFYKNYQTILEARK